MFAAKSLTAIPRPIDKRDENAAKIPASTAPGSALAPLPMSAMCHKPTLARLFDHLVGALLEKYRHIEAERLGGF